MSARLGIVTGNPAAHRGDGALLMNHANGRVFDALRRAFPGCRISLPILPVPTASMTHVLGFTPAEVTPLPPLASTLVAQRHARETRRRLRNFVRDRDRLLLKVPFQLTPGLLGLGLPKVVHAVTDPFECIACSDDYRGVLAWPARLYARHVERTMRRLAHEPRTRLVTNGGALWQKLGGRHGRVVVSSCLHADELEGRPRAPLGDPPRLLFVGYVRPEKGALVLVDAFERLRALRPLRLTIVGATDRLSTRADRALADRVARSRFRTDIDALGMVDFGSALFQLYRDHDVLVCPSLSEGTPRVLVEARGFGCPVVASDVGGIPASVRHGVDGWLVPPGDAAALADGIALILDDELLRARLVDAGQRTAQACSLEGFVAALADEIASLA